MAPIRKGDGTPLEIPGVSEVRSGDGRVFFEGDAIPDSVVSRPEDTAKGTDNAERGKQIELKSDWPSIGARISSKTSGATRAYLRDNDFNLIDDVDISALSAGDTFTFDGVDLQSGQKYLISLDAEGADWENGDFSDADFPYTSEDVDITGRVVDSNIDQERLQAINDIGNVGF